jgi:tRNA G18 (ribose-2'-O)-methylase SpoU
VQQAYNIGAIFRLCDAMLAERLGICCAEVYGRAGHGDCL